MAGAFRANASQHPGVRGVRFELRDSPNVWEGSRIMPLLEFRNGEKKMAKSELRLQSERPPKRTGSFRITLQSHDIHTMLRMSSGTLRITCRQLAAQFHAPCVILRAGRLFNLHHQRIPQRWIVDSHRVRVRPNQLLRIGELLQQPLDLRIGCRGRGLRSGAGEDQTRGGDHNASAGEVHNQRLSATHTCGSKGKPARLVRKAQNCYAATMSPLIRFCLALAAVWFGAHAEAASCVWKLTATDGKTLYLGGSVHALGKSDHPLPSAYLQAFDASTHLAFEIDSKAMSDTTTELLKAGQYPKGDSLKNHVDPRTYAYVRRLFDLLNVSEEQFHRARPWMIVLALEAASMRGSSTDFGVDKFLMDRAKAKGKPVIGLETAREHAAVYSGLSDREAEILLLVTFIPDVAGSGAKKKMMQAWRRGDVDALHATARLGYREFPAFAERLLEARNRAWLPKIEAFLHSGRTYFVVVGAGHLGGSEGLLPLLRQRGYQLEQL